MLNFPEIPRLGQAIFCPEQLVSKAKNSYNVNEVLLRRIETLEKPIVALSCLGPFRSGKSFLLNCLTHQRYSNGFNVGHTTDSCTKGIVAQAFPLLVNGVRKCTVIFFDIQGTKACDSTDSDDAIYCTLVLLLSQICIMNSSSVIQRGTIQDLKIFSDMAHFIQRSSSTDEDSAHRTLIWILRDFTLGLGKKKTPLQYLESILYSKGSVTLSRKESLIRGEIRNEVLSHFENMDCFTLPPPFIENGSKHTLREGNAILSPSFETDMVKLNQMIMKYLNNYSTDESASIDGLTFSYLVRLYIGCLNKERSIMQLSPAEVQLETILHSFVNEAVNIYHQNMRHILENPVSSTQLDEIHLDAYSLSQSFLQRQLKKYPLQARRLEAKFNAIIFGDGVHTKGVYVEYKLENSRKLTGYHELLIKELGASFMGRYTSTGSFAHQKYHATLEQITTEFKRQSIDSIEASNVLLSYIQSSNEEFQDIHTFQRGFDRQISILNQEIVNKKIMVDSSSGKHWKINNDLRVFTQALDLQAKDLLQRYDNLQNSQELSSRNVELEMDVLYSEMMNYYTTRYTTLNDVQKREVKRLQQIPQEQMLDYVERNIGGAEYTHQAIPQKPIKNQAMQNWISPALDILSSAGSLANGILSNDTSNTEDTENSDFSAMSDLVTGVSMMGMLTKSARVILPIISIICGIPIGF